MDEIQNTNEPIQEEVSKFEAKALYEGTDENLIMDGQVSIANESPEVTSPIIEEKERGKWKKKFKEKLLPYFMVALIGSIIGGTIVGAGAFYVVPKLDVFKNSALTKTLNNQTTQTSQPSLISSTQGNLTVTEIAKRVGPAVVGVSTKSMVNNIFGFGWPFSTPQEQESMGSGIIFNQDGYIVTNYHVIEGAQQVTVILNNAKEVKAKVINYDAAADIAVIKMTEKVDIPGIAEFGDSDKLQVGELAVAIGNPLGKDLLGSVTAGVISATNREIEVEGRKLKLLQTDAAINPGNSGGPLVNSQGQVIGINTVKMSANAVEGLGFAIPINEVKPKIQELIAPRLVIGIKGKDITEELSKQYDLPIGVYVVEVDDFSAAQRAGIHVGDVIVKVAGEKVASINDINKVKAKYKAGDELKVEISRDGESKTLTLKLVESKN